MILATVKGDVHDIGKNLVDIILSNNGFKVIDLGIKVTPQQLIEAVKDEKPDIIGLSGLLVKSAQQMVLTAQDLTQSSIDVPIMVGGAALSRKFTDFKIAPEYEGAVLYAKDAMDGLALANKLQNKEEVIQLLADLKTRQEKKVTVRERQPQTAQAATAVLERSAISTDVPVFVPADLKRHVVKHYDLAQVLPYINWQMLLGHHLGLKGKVNKLLAEKTSVLFN